jgi:heptosyltransferase-2
MKNIDLSRAERILVIMMGGIGNMIFLTPAVKALRKTCPGSRLTFLLGPYGAEKVIEGGGLMDEKIIVDFKKYGGIRGMLRLVRKLRKQDFSLSIAATGTNWMKTGLLCYLAGIRYRLGERFKRSLSFYNLEVPFDENIHEVEANIRMIERLGIKVEDKSLSIHVSPEDRNFARAVFSENNLVGQSVIGMHPGSGVHQAKFKRWPKERFAGLADRLSDDYQASVIIFGGRDEVDLGRDISGLMTKTPLLMTGKTTLSQAAALIEKCRLFISNDSGLMHVACSVRTPTVGLYGPTDYKKTGPWSDCGLMVRKELDCSPCYKKGKVKCTDLDCLHSITVEDVLAAINRLMKSKG